MKADVKYLIQARLGSTRFKEKVLENIYGEFNLIDIMIERISLSKFYDKNNLVVLTSTSSQDDKLVKYLTEQGINYYRGDENFVFLRFQSYLNSLVKKPNYFFRICSDNPFLDPTLLDELVDKMIVDNAVKDYYSHKDFNDVPAILTHYGFFAELIKTETFMSIEIDSLKKSENEHVTPMFYNGNYFSNSFIEMDTLLKNKNIRLTFDTAEDLSIIKELYNLLDSTTFSYRQAVETIEQNETLLLQMESNIKNNRKV